MANVSITRDFSGAIRKTQALKAMPRAFKKILGDWESGSVKELKDYVRKNLKKSGKTSSHLFRNIGGTVVGDANTQLTVTVGTGVGNTATVKYARIQDEGGTIHKKDKMLTIPFPGVMGRARNFAGTFFFKSKAGSLILAQRVGKKIRPLFTLKDQVTLPATDWFSKPMRQRLAYLEMMAQPEYVYGVAEKMALGVGLGNED